MGLFDFFLKDNGPAKKQANIVTPMSESFKNEEYLKMREFEEEWLESHYDFNSIDGINSIPLSKNLMRPPTKGVTGEVYYYLHRKAYKHEDAGNIELAIACMRKSIDLMMVQGYYGQKECYDLVKLLARNGYVKEAESEKASFDQIYLFNSQEADKNSFQELCRDAAKLRTDLIIMSVLGSTCPECAKYQGRVYSISGKSKLFPKIPDIIASTGHVHDNCGHTFYPYIHGVSNPELDYTLSVHPLQNKKYGRDIIAFSNRPFVDDRTEECQKSAEEVRKKNRIKAEQEQYAQEHMIEIEVQRGIDIRNYRWLQENLPDKCPKSVAGYRRMKTQNTKNFQMLQKLAANLGRNL